jgi:(4-(4-[2-(gamma-L-glutamylamino)ethyl]phenoxymethyl)furan-2-yl)methanamine synthase
LAITMTGELADCFASKSAGVQFILDAVTRAAGGCEVRVYLTDGRLVPVETALAEPLAAAAANWHALASFAARYAPEGPVLSIDIGSTTCDLIPLIDGRVAAGGRDDTGRLIRGELVYTGVERSPVCAVVARVAYRGSTCPPAQELFATMRDVYLVLGDLPEDACCRDTADGQPATREAARRRLARVICADVAQFTADDAIALAAAAAAAQADLVSRAVRDVIAAMPDPPRTWIVSGHGDFLLRRIRASAGFAGNSVFLTQRLGPHASRVATAHALAVLARERSSR